MVEVNLSEKIRILVVDDHALFRDAVAALVSAEPDLKVVAQATQAQEAVELVEQTQPDVVLMDISMPGVSCFEAARRIKKRRPEARILFLTMHDDEELLREAFQIDAVGYLMKDSEAEELLSAIRGLPVGEPCVSQSLVKRLVRGVRPRDKYYRWEGVPGVLTDRERDYLRLYAEGKQVKEIVAALNLSVRSVYQLKADLKKKLGIASEGQLIRYALSQKSTALPANPAGGSCPQIAGDNRKEER